MKLSYEILKQICKSDLSLLKDNNIQPGGSMVFKGIKSKNAADGLTFEIIHHLMVLQKVNKFKMPLFMKEEQEIYNSYVQ